MDGLINLLKEPGYTSHDQVAALRRLLKTKKVGHAGTLDPGAAGVLPICVGQGTRVAEYMMDKNKTYRAEIVFGIETETQDAGGKVLCRQPGARVELSQLEEVLESFKGEIKQLPPMVSAVHYQGRRLYEWARQGKTVERQPRKVVIHSLKVISFQGERLYPSLLLDIKCSRGTYIRTLCADIGARLGCGAYLSFLIRTSSGDFHLQDAYTLTEIQDMLDRGDYSFLLPVDYALKDIPALTVKEKAVPFVLNGLPLAPSGIRGGVGTTSGPGLVRLYDPQGTLLALGNYHSQPGGTWLYKPLKVFHLQQNKSTGKEV